MMSCSNYTSVHYSFRYYACVQVQLAAKTSIFLVIFPGAQRGSAAQKAYFLKTNIVELKIGLNFKGISVSYLPEVR